MCSGDEARRMSEKKDFLSELAKEVSDKKTGKRDHIDTIDDWQPAHKNMDYQDALDPDDVVSQPAVKEKQSFSHVKEPEEEVQPLEGNENIYEDNSGRPGSFEEEKFTKIVKPKKHVSLMGKILLIATAAVIVFAIYWFGFAPHIELPDFTGKNISEVSTWARQNQMASSAIATAEPVYSMDYDADVVMEQSVKGGTKVKKTTPITFTVSAGPDPNEAVSFPDIKSMSKDEIQSWINDNKLMKAKISTEYSDTVAADQVISYEVKNGDESDFTRNTTVNIKVSKGPAPEGQITITDFTNKTLAEAQAFATKNGLNLVQQESFSDTTVEGNIMSQTPASGQAAKKGDAFTVVVSKGKGVKIPNLVGYTAEQFEAWQKASSNSSIAIVTSSVYNAAAPGSVIAQDVKPGTMLGSGDVLMITTSLYLPIMEKTSTEWLGKDWMELKSWVDDANWKGADIQAGQYNEYQYNECSDTYPTPGQIIDYACYYGNTDEAKGCGRPLNIGSRIAYKVSTGACTVTPATNPSANEEPSTPAVPADITPDVMPAGEKTFSAMGTYTVGTDIGAGIYTITSTDVNCYEITSQGNSPLPSDGVQNVKLTEGEKIYITFAEGKQSGSAVFKPITE